MWAWMPSRPRSKAWHRPAGPATMPSASVSMAAVLGTAGIVDLLDQFRQLAGLVFPLVGIGQRGLALGDARPALGQVGVDLDHVLLVARHVFLRHDRIDRALGDAD